MGHDTNSDDELIQALLSKPVERLPEKGESRRNAEILDAILAQKFCPDCPHEKIDHPKKNRFRCRWCECEGTSIKRAVYRRQRGKRMPS